MNKVSLEAEESYAESLREPLNKANELGEADIVVGIPFWNEADTIGHVCETVVKGISQFHSGKRCVVVCAGAIEGEDALKRIGGMGLPRDIHMIAFLMKSKRVSGRVWTLRAVMEIADRLGAELALFEPDLKTRESAVGNEGLTPEWVDSLVLPVEKEGMDLVVPQFNRHYLCASASTLLVSPLLASIFNVAVSDLPGGVLGMSSKLVRAYLGDPNIWSNEDSALSIDSLLITSAVVNEAKICEANFGVKTNDTCLEEEADWRQQARAIFEQVAAASSWWLQKGDMVYPLAKFGGGRKGSQPEELALDPVPLMERYRRGFNEFQGLYGEILSREALVELRKLAGSDPEAFRVSSDLWAEIVYEFLLTYCLGQEFTKDNILNAFLPICYGRAASHVQELGMFRDKIKTAIPEEAERITSLVAARAMESQTGVFIRQKPGFVARWIEKERALKPILPGVTYREFIPGVPLIVPKELISPTGEVVSTDSIYRELLQRYHAEFEEFIYGRLNIARAATSTEVARRVEELMLQVEKDIDELLLPGDISTVDETRAVVNAVFEKFPHSDTFALKPQVASWILQRNPPSNLLIKFGAASLTELEQAYGPNDILALSSLSEDLEHTVKVWNWIAGNARPEHFTYLALQPLVVSRDDFPVLTVLREPSALSRLTGRIIASNLRKGAGGEFPKLRYFTTMAKHIVEAERFGDVWQQFAHERKEFGTRVVNSLRGHRGGEPLSAHNMFENKLQRMFIERLKKMRSDLASNGDSPLLRLAGSLAYVVDSYHLAQSLPDGKFIPCSTWTWASYRFKGGAGIPTPFSLHVERDWASREFLVRLLEATGVSEESMDRKITELMGQGSESANLAWLMLPGWETVQEVMPEQLPRPAEPEAGKLSRFIGNPILRAVPEHKWESKYVFNPGAIRLEGKIYILYRACGEDEVSRIGLAISSDGFNIEERLERPIFEPDYEWEKRGCEDPRLILIEDQIYMLYTAYDSVVAQIALASIGVEDFLNRRWDKWRKQGLVFPGFGNKDATLFPQAFNGRYFMYHRIEPSIWISSADCLDFPWPGEDHRILLGPGAGMAWDGFKLGGGSQPIKTKYGWLLIYHGVDNSWVYRLGVLLVGLDDPGWLLYRSPNPVLEPEENYELGEEGRYVPNVVFTCGAVPRVDKETLEDDDEILVYYGAADTTACVATAKVSDLIPEEIRRSRNHGSYQV